LASYRGHIGRGVMNRRKLTLDAHDDQERDEIQNILSELPKDHPAWIARRDGADAIKLMHLVDRKHLVDKLTIAWLDGHWRMLRRSSKSRP
jgi:hypothetical protein